MRALALLGVLAVSACNGPTELLLVVQSDIGPDQLAYVEIATASSLDAELGTDANGNQAQPCICVSSSVCDDPVALPLTVPLEPGEQGDAPFQVVARGHRPKEGGCGKTPFIQDSAELSFAPHERLGVYLSLDAPCIGVVCGAHLTCDSGTGMCVGDSTTPTKLGDLSPIAVVDLAPPDLSALADLSVPPDLAVPVDLAPPYVTLGMVPSTNYTLAWDVASNGSDYSLIVTGVDDMGQPFAAYGPVVRDGDPGLTMLPINDDGTPTQEVCVANSGSSYVYGVESTGYVEIYASTPNGLMQLVDDSSATAPGDIQCKGDSTGVSIGWLDVYDTIPGNPLPLYLVRTSLDTTVTPVMLPPLGAFSFALANVYSAPNQVDPTKSTMLVADPPSPPPLMKEGSVPDCPGLLEAYQLVPDGGFAPAAIFSAGDMGTTPCVALDATHVSPSPQYAVAAVGEQVVAAGSAEDSALEVGVPPTFRTPVDVAFSTVAMAPLPPIAMNALPGLVIAVVYTPGTTGSLERPDGLYLVHASSNGTFVSKQFLSKTLDRNMPVKLAVKDGSEVLVTWIEPTTSADGGTADVLVGEIVTP